ncbi:NAD(P)/FAD-dependent oxidoreductase [Amycolatopsis sp. NPDC021455]|uniref:NAD(P)/FAD-dependent oxidoreductase n=1 Tax=Amycolatopsis sp. NPDC021455 TaxID=3154901 RepID=UPI0033FC75E4
MLDKTQILVIGGGPAGSTAAGLLARQGFQVTLLERDSFPRYHIGESILPSCRPIFDQLGVLGKIEAAGFTPKGGAYFFWGEEEWEVRFAAQGGAPNAWQVVRSEMDKILLDHARELGVGVHEQTAVRELEFDAGRPVAARWDSGETGESGRITFDYLVDASGRAGVMATKYLKSRKLHGVFRNVATWSYWKGAKKLDRGPENAIAVCSLPEGWFWAIPLHDGTVSVGLVTGREHFNERKRELGGIDRLYHDAIERCPAIRDLLGEATQVTELKVEQDYSYVCDDFAGPGFVISGDAACFLDPLLSTGVHLATYSGMLGAAAIGSVLRGEVREEEALEFYRTVYRHSYERLLLLVSVFYESYRGKDYHFYNAQSLTADEHAGLSLQDSFDRIVTGIEDLSDARAAYERVREHLNGAESGDPIPLNNLNRLHEQKKLPFSPDTAVTGLYLVTEPELGLRRAQAPVAPR